MTLCVKIPVFGPRFCDATGVGSRRGGLDSTTIGRANVSDAGKPLYPIYVRLCGRKCVVVGGGSVAARKVASLCEAGAEVHVVSPSVVEEIAQRDGVVLHHRRYDPSLLDGASLVFACTDDTGVNHQVADDARARGALCNAADYAPGCDFFMPACFRRGRLQIAVGTRGASPKLAASIRRQLESLFGEEYAVLLDELARLRKVVLSRVADGRARRAILETLCSDYSLELLRNEDLQGWRAWSERAIAVLSEPGAH